MQSDNQQAAKLSWWRQLLTETSCMTGDRDATWCPAHIIPKTQHKQRNTIQQTFAHADTTERRHSKAVLNSVSNLIEPDILFDRGHSRSLQSSLLAGNAAEAGQSCSSLVNMVHKRPKLGLQTWHRMVAVTL